MSCSRCRTGWDATRTPCCPACLAGRWLATPELLRQKHDPRVLGARHARYRSVLTPRLLDEIESVLTFAAATGRWFHDTDYGMLVHLTRTPLGRAAGVGIPAGQREPEHALDCLLIAEADSSENAHIFAVDGARHDAQVKAGVFRPLGACSEGPCRNLAFPTEQVCVEHSDRAAPC